MGILSGIKKSAKSLAISLAMGMKRMEEKSITQLGVNENNDMIRQHEQNSLTNDLMNGRSNTRVKVYTERFYQILENADKYAKRNRMNFNGDIESGEISLEPTQINEQEYYDKRSKELDLVVDKNDEYKLESIIELKKTCINEMEIVSKNAKPLFDTNIKLFKGDDELILMDNTLEVIHLKSVPDEEGLKLIDLFFTFDSYEVYYMNDVLEGREKFFEFDSLSINKGKYKPNVELYDVVKVYGMSVPSRNKLCYKVLVKKVVV